jgi:magnesium transporter
MIRTLLYDPAGGSLSAGGEELLERWQQAPDTVIWADFAGEQKESERRVLEQAFDIHPLAISDAQRERHPPKLEAFENYSFVLLKELAPDTEGFKLATTQLAVFVGRNFLVTRHPDLSPIVEGLFQRAAANTSLFGEGNGALLLRMCRVLVDDYVKMLLGIEPRLEELEQEIMENPRDTMLAELLGYKTELKRFRRVFIYHEQILRGLKSRHFPGVGDDITHQVNDVYEHQERVGSLADLYYELASDMIEGYISFASHNLNQIMKILTVVMSIFVPLSFLAGIYGMNFENMPELHSPSGYFILLGVMGTIALILLYLFRRKHWL